MSDWCPENDGAYRMEMAAMYPLLYRDRMARLEELYEAALEKAKEAEAYARELEAENEKLRKGLDIYQRERDRFKHANPEMTGAYFLTGGHGPKDDNQMPKFVEVIPSYGCGWSMIYEDTGRTISYEGT